MSPSKKKGSVAPFLTLPIPHVQLLHTGKRCAYCDKMILILIDVLDKIVNVGVTLNIEYSTERMNEAITAQCRHCGGVIKWYPFKAIRESMQGAALEMKAVAERKDPSHVETNKGSYGP